MFEWFTLCSIQSVLIISSVWGEGNNVPIGSYIHSIVDNDTSRYMYLSG